MPTHDEPALTPDEERFVEEYLIDPNGTTAYLRVHPGVKRTTAADAAYRLLRKPEISEAVRRGRRLLASRCKASAEDVLRGLAALAFYDIGAATDLTRNELVLLPPRDIPFEVRQAITAVKVKKRTVARADGSTEETQEIEYRFANKLAALDALARHLGLFQDLPPLEVLLNALPPKIADTVRAALAAALHADGISAPESPG